MHSTLEYNILFYYAENVFIIGLLVRDTLVTTLVYYMTFRTIWKRDVTFLGVEQDTRQDKMHKGGRWASRGYPWGSYSPLKPFTEARDGLCTCMKYFRLIILYIDSEI